MFKAAVKVLLTALKSGVERGVGGASRRLWLLWLVLTDKGCDWLDPFTAPRFCTLTVPIDLLINNNTIIDTKGGVQGRSEGVAYGVAHVVEGGVSGSGDRGVGAWLWLL